MKKALQKAATSATDGNNYQKFTSPSTGLGGTVFPKKPSDQEYLGVRYDYHGETTRADGEVYNIFQLQPNRGKVNSTIKSWRESHGGTHATMAHVYVRKDGTKEDVEKGLADANEDVLTGEPTKKGPNQKGSTTEGSKEEGSDEKSSNTKSSKKKSSNTKSSNTKSSNKKSSNTKSSNKKSSNKKN